MCDGTLVSRSSTRTTGGIAVPQRSVECDCCNDGGNLIFAPSCEICDTSEIRHGRQDEITGRFQQAHIKIIMLIRQELHKIEPLS